MTFHIPPWNQFTTKNKKVKIKMSKYVQQAYIIDAVQMTPNNHIEVAAWLITHGAEPMTMKPS